MAVSPIDGYISLKEAAARTGYSADYIGQLIRSGKLHGKQVYSHVAWVTTEDALHAYLEGGKKEQRNGSFSGLCDMVSEETLARLFRIVVWGAIGLFSVFSLGLGYVFAVSIDHSIEQQQLQKLERNDA